MGLYHLTSGIMMIVIGDTVDMVQYGIISLYISIMWKLMYNNDVYYVI